MVGDDGLEPPTYAL